jgi:hypothetical protein
MQIKTQVKYQPKGAVCITCTNSKQDCSLYDFQSMPKIESFEVKEQDALYKVFVVKCIHFERKI